MKKFLLALLFAPTVQIALSQSRTQHELVITIETLRQAIVNADTETLGRLTDDSLDYGHSDGTIENKKEFIGNLASGKHDFVTMDLSDQKIVFKGNVAVVRHHLTAKTNNGGKEGSANLSVMQFWLKDKGRWKLLGRQAVKVT